MSEEIEAISDTGRTVLDAGPQYRDPSAVMPLWPQWRMGGRTLPPGPAKAVITVLAIGVLLWIPQYFGQTDVERYTEIMCLAIAAAGLNLLTGFNGQISVGHGAFYALGAYTSLLLVIEQEWPFWAAALVAALASFALGLIVGVPALRIKGLYLAIATLALAVLTPQIIIRFSDLTGGTQGVRVSKQQTPEVYDFNRPPEGSGLAPDQYRYYIVLAVTVIAFLLIRNLVRSRVGRALIATRDNETAAEVVGVPLARYKIVTFGLSAMLAGIGGAMASFESGQVAANTFNITLSITILVAVVVGGAATITGPAIGAFLVIMLPEWLPSDVPELAPVLFGLSLVLLMRVAPGGIVGLLRRGMAQVSRRVNRPSTGGSPDDLAPDTVPSALS